MRHDGDVIALFALDRDPDEIRQDDVDVAGLQRDLAGLGVGEGADVELEVVRLVEAERLHGAELPLHGAGLHDTDREFQRIGLGDLGEPRNRQQHEGGTNQRTHGDLLKIVLSGLAF